MIARLLSRLFPPLLAGTFGVCAMLLFLRRADADPVVATPPAGFDWAFWLAIASAIGTALSFVLHRVALKTHNAKLEAVAQDVDTLRGLVPTTAPTLAIAPAPRDKQAGKVRDSVLLAMAAAGLLSYGVLFVASCSATQARQTIAAGAVAALDCEAQHLTGESLGDLRGLAERTVQGWISGAKVADLDTLRAKVKADLALFKTDAGRCAIAGAVAAIGAAASTPGTAVSALSSGADPTMARAAFALEARAAAWPALVLASGPV